ncbi:hypothetical protein RIF29_02090 [Crotalaria pallida]|uniref:Uncharacterized protein n=1 Tax=Crotalaria pallida TaxID=3830 RepID=A0AAN9J0B9_CROPI
MHGPWCEIRGTWCPVLDPLGLIHGALSLVRDHWCMVWCEICGSWCMVRDPRCIDPGAWSGATSLAPGAWSAASCLVPGAWILVHGLVRDPWYLVPGAWCMVPCPWCEIRGTRCMDPGAWSGARSVVPGAWCVVPGAWRLVPGAWIQVHGLVRDPWYPVHGAWSLVPGAWYVIPGAWILVHGALSLVRDPWCMDPCAWSGARSVVPGAWCMVHGALSLVPDPWYMVWCEIRGTRCMVRDPWCMDPGAWSGGLAGCLPMHHGGSGWCVMGASPNAFSSHPMDVWSVFPWRGGDSKESSVEPNPGRTTKGQESDRPQVRSGRDGTGSFQVASWAMHARGIVAFLNLAPWRNASKGIILFGLSLSVTKHGPFDAILGEFIEKPNEMSWHCPWGVHAPHGRTCEKMRHNVQMGSRGIVLDVVRVAPSEADAALSDASICLLALGNAGRGSFDSVVSCKRECV